MKRNEQNDSKIDRRIAELLAAGGPESAEWNTMSWQALSEELRTYHQELVHQNDELLRNSYQLETARAELQSLFDDAPIGYVVFDREFRIQAANKALSQYIGIEVPALKDRQLTDFIHPDYQDKLYLSVRKLLAGEKTVEIDKLRLRLTSSVDAVYFNANRQAGAEASAPVLIRAAFVDLSQRIKAEAALAASEQKFRTYTEHAPIAILVSDLDGKLERANAAAEKLTGYSRAELLTMEAADLIRSRPNPGQIREKNTLWPNHRGARDVQLQRKDGSFVWTNVALEPVGDQTVIGFVQDISARKAYEEAMQSSYEQLLTVFDSVDALIYVADIETYEVLFVNQLGRGIWGDAVGKRCWRFIRPGNGGPCRGCANNDVVDDQGRPARVVRSEYYDEENQRWYDCMERAIVWNDGRVVRLHIAYDITRRVTSEQELKKKKEHLEFVIRGTNDGIWDWDIAADTLYLSPKWKEQLGYAEHELDSDYGTVIERVHPDDRSEVERVFQQCLQGNTSSCDLEYRMRHKDGSYRWLRSRGEAFQDHNGKVNRMAGSNTDITERKQFQEALFSEKEQLRATLLSVGDGVISTDNLGRITVMNPVAERQTGWREHDAVGRSLAELFAASAKNYQTIDAAVAEVLTTGIPFQNKSCVLRHGKKADAIFVEANAAPIKDKEGQTAGAIMVLRDVTERLQRQREIEFLSYRDPLTGVHNRRYMDEARKVMDAPDNYPLAVMMLDVNGLKITNDAFGHHFGDILLQSVAAGIQRMIGRSDIITRMGGDEFALLLPKTGAEGAAAIAKKIAGEMTRLHLDGERVSLALGWAVKTDSSQDFAHILRTADNKMYRQKRKRGSSVPAPSPDMTAAARVSYSDGQQSHLQWVSQYCEATARALQLSDDEIHVVKNAAALHDLGKIIIPQAILSKPANLTHEEILVLRRHPETGYQLLKSLDQYRDFAEAVLHHHERWDGSGYPHGLSQTGIPLPARIIAVADAYDAMTARRPYQKAKNPQEAAASILRSAGSQFDPEVARVFVETVLPDQGQGPYPRQ